MIWYILAAIAFIAIIICAIHEEGFGGDTIFASLIIGTLLCLLVLVLNGGCVLCAVLAGVETESVLSETREITALNDATSTSGSYFLGSGHVDDEMCYYFIEETEKGKSLDSISADNAYIIESNTETPRIEKWTKAWTNEKLVFWFTIFSPGGYEYKIYIPANSVTTNFSIDLETGATTPGTTTTPTSTSATNHCAHCNHPMSEADNFCPNCGSSATLPTSYCTNCGREASNDENYCPSCGTQKGSDVG